MTLLSKQLVSHSHLLGTRASLPLCHAMSPPAFPSSLPITSTFCSVPLVKDNTSQVVPAGEALPYPFIA